MRKIIIALFFISLFLSSCKKSMDDDAKDAAKLARQSIEYSKEKNVDKAEKSFLESQEIIDRYRQTPQYAEFEMMYNKYLLEGIDE